MICLAVSTQSMSVTKGWMDGKIKQIARGHIDECRLSGLFHASSIFTPMCKVWVIITGRTTFLHINKVGKNPPTWASHLPTRGISPKRVSRLFFLRWNHWPKSILHISKCVTTHVQPCRISKTFLGVTPQPPASRAGEGARRERGKKGKGRMEGRIGEGREGKENGDRPPTIFGFIFGFRGHLSLHPPSRRLRCLVPTSQ